MCKALSLIPSIPSKIYFIYFLVSGKLVGIYGNTVLLGGVPRMGQEGGKVPGVGESRGHRKHSKGQRKALGRAGGLGKATFLTK
jgi:hypothetical protein